MNVIRQFPHCDQRVLHAPGECEFCDRHPEWQELRIAWSIAFTGHPALANLPKCGRPMRDTFPGYGPSVRCGEPHGHNGDCHPYPALAALPCPADAARPAASAADHRRWGGNKPTSATGDPSWPAESTASVALYGDRGGRAPWPLPERVIRRLRRPLEDWRKRRRGWRKVNGWWRFP